MQMKLFVLLMSLSFAAKQNKNAAESDGKCGQNMNESGAETIFVKIEEDAYAKTKRKEPSSQFIGVWCEVKSGKWRTQRRSKHEKKIHYNGSYDDEETAALASDTLARKLIEIGEQGHKLNFPYDDTEVLPEKTCSSQFIGVSYDVKSRKWRANRHSKHEKKIVCNGCYKNEETAAHASDALARKLIANGEQAHKLNFPYDDTEVFPDKKDKSSQFIGVVYNFKISKWQAERRSKHKKKNVYNGYYENEETAAYASDTLARKLMSKGEQNHKLNFPDDDIEVLKEMKGSSHFIGVYNINASQWQAQRYSKHETKNLHNGTYKNEETAAHASDTLARQLIANGEKNHKLNFPDDDTEVYAELQRKRKRPVRQNSNHHKND